MLRIYLAGAKNKESRIPPVLDKIAALLKDSDAAVLSNIPELSINPLSSAEINQAEKEGKVLLDKMDAFIIDGSSGDSEIGYIVAYALFRKKHVLYLLPSGKDLDPALDHLSSRKEISPFFHLRHWTPQVLINHARDFIKLLSLEAGESEVPSIKFTLRITPKIDQYLTFRAKRSNAKKADFLRDLIEDEIKKDKFFNKER